jgi:hypothetical protein
LVLPQLVAALAACTQAAPEAEADPALLYSTGHVLPYAYGAYPYVLPYAPLAAGCTNNDGKLVPCAHGYGVVPVAAAAPAAEEPAVAAVEKREAEPVAEATAEAAADPEADPWLYYSGLWGGYGHYAYRPFAYSYAPYTYSHVYSHYGLPYAYYGKRSADAEPTADAEPAADAKADPWLAYGYGYHPYSYGYAGYRGYYGYPYAYYGKRSADAEPTADADPKADPWLTYGYYGHYPYTYGYAHHGYYGYPYSYGYWGKK